MGTASIIAGTTELIKKKRILKSWNTASGKVTELELRYKPHTDELYWPHYEYIVNGETCKGVGKIGSDPASYKIGQSILVYVDPNDVMNSEIYDFRFKILPWSLISLGFAFYIFVVCFSV